MKSTNKKNCIIKHTLLISHIWSDIRVKSNYNRSISGKNIIVSLFFLFFYDDTIIVAQMGIVYSTIQLFFFSSNLLDFSPFLNSFYPDPVGYFESNCPPPTFFLFFFWEREGEKIKFRKELIFLLVPFSILRCCFDIHDNLFIKIIYIFCLFFFYLPLCIVYIEDYFKKKKKNEVALIWKLSQENLSYILAINC